MDLHERLPYMAKESIVPTLLLLEIEYQSYRESDEEITKVVGQPTAALDLTFFLRELERLNVDLSEYGKTEHAIICSKNFSCSMWTWEIPYKRLLDRGFGSFLRLSHVSHG